MPRGRRSGLAGVWCTNLVKGGTRVDSNSETRKENSRLLDLDETHVTFRWKDYRESGDHQSKVMRITIAEFIRRFLLHVLPNGFHRIRSYGFLANGHCADKLALWRSLLDVPSAPMDHNNDDDNDPSVPNHEPPPCPCCGGRMKIIETFNGPLSRPYHVRRLDAL